MEETEVNENLVLVNSTLSHLYASISTSLTVFSHSADEISDFLLGIEFCLAILGLWIITCLIACSVVEKMFPDNKKKRIVKSRNKQDSARLPNSFELANHTSSFVTNKRKSQPLTLSIIHVSKLSYLTDSE